MSSDVKIIWSQVGVGEVVIQSPFDLGTLDPLAPSFAYELSFYFTSTTTAILDNCGVFLSPYSGIYLVQGRNALEDWRSIRKWGDIKSPSDLIGFQFNFDKADNYPESSWIVAESARGTNAFNKIPLPKEAVVPSGGGTYDQDGKLPITATAYFKVQVNVPEYIGAVGKYFADIVVDYTV